MPATYQSTIVQAPAEAVWKRLRNFHDMSWAAGVVDKCEAAGDRAGDQIGAQRVLNDVFHETLRGLDDTTMTMHYSIDEGPSPVSSREVSDYGGTVHVVPATEDGACVVEWYSRWEAPNDDGVPFCGDIYKALLGRLRGHFGG